MKKSNKRRKLNNRKSKKLRHEKSKNNDDGSEVLDVVDLDDSDEESVYIDASQMLETEIIEDDDNLSLNNSKSMSKTRVNDVTVSQENDWNLDDFDDDDFVEQKITLTPRKSFSLSSSVPSPTMKIMSPDKVEFSENSMNITPKKVKPILRDIDSDSDIDDFEIPTQKFRRPSEVLSKSPLFNEGTKRASPKSNSKSPPKGKVSPKKSSPKGKVSPKKSSKISLIKVKSITGINTNCKNSPESARLIDNSSKSSWHSPSEASPLRSMSDKNLILSPSVRRSMSKFGLSKTPIKNSPTSRNLFAKSPQKIKTTPKKLTNLYSPINNGLSPVDKNMAVTPNKTPSKAEANSENMPVTPNKSPSKAKRNSENYRNVNGMYLDNFLQILDAVVNNPSDYKLFNEEDRSIVENFYSLSLAAKKLYVRLFQRKLNWKRVDKIEYGDVSDKEDIIQYIEELATGKFLLTDKDIDMVEDVLEMMTAEEITALAKDMKVTTQGRTKKQLMASLARNNKAQPSIAAAFGASSSSTSRIVLKK